MQVSTKIKLAGVACLAALLPMLMGPTGGYPSQPTFVQTTTTGSVPGAALNVQYNSSNTATNKCWLQRIGSLGAWALDTCTDAFADNSANQAFGFSRSGATVTAVFMGNPTDNPTYTFNGTGAATFGGNLSATGTGGNVAQKNAANSFSATPQTISALNAAWVANGSAGAGVAMFKMQNNGTDKAYFCLSDAAGACTVGDAANDVSIRGDAVVWFSTASGGNSFASLTQAGVFNVKSGGDVQVNAVSVCRSDGTNCPAAAVTTATTTQTIPFTTAGNCSVNGTNGTMVFRRVGNIVSATWTVAGNCTTAAVSFWISPTTAIPAGYVPAHQSNCLQQSTLDGTATVTNNIFNTDGHITISNPVSAATHTSWASVISYSCTYNLD